MFTQVAIYINMIKNNNSIITNSNLGLNNINYDLINEIVGPDLNFEIINRTTQPIDWNGIKQNSVNLEWTSNRNGYAILTKGCSIYAQYYSEVSYSVKLNDEVIDNSSSYRVDVGHDANNRTFLFPIKVGDIIKASVTGSTNTSVGTLTLCLWASVISDSGSNPNPEEPTDGSISKINLNGTTISLANNESQGTIKAPVLLWENENPFTPTGSFTVNIDNLSSLYYAVLILHDVSLKYGTSSVIPVGEGGYLIRSGNYNTDASATNNYRYVNVGSSFVSFYTGHGYGSVNLPGVCIPYKIFGITKELYDILQPVNRV